MDEKLCIRTLGDLSIQLGKEPVEDLGTRKAEALVVYLAGTGRSQAREVLAELLWEDRAQGQAQANLRVALSGLKKRLGAYLEITRESVGLDPDAGIWYDVEALEQGLELARGEGGVQTKAGAESAAGALALYRGEFLEGFYIKEARGFNEWLLRERERVHRLVLGGLHDLVAYELQRGAYADGIGHAERLLALDPLMESGHRQMMQLLAYSGRRAEALAQYESCRKLLWEELGVEPAAATQALYEKLRTGGLVQREEGLRQIRGYELLEQIGSGSYGAVYRAYQPSVARGVAVKVILPQYANDPEFIRRFEAEAQVVARLEHPRIVPLYDYWREPDGAYLVMRLCPGGSLEGLLERGPLELGQAAELLEQVTAGLALAHKQGVVHRDLKPANILLDEAGEAYLSDFGIAKVLDEALAQTHPGELLGSPVYSSPEQLRNEAVTPQSDIYSLGVLLYQVLTGKTPFEDSSLAELVERQLTMPLPCVTDEKPEFPPEVDQVIQKATAKDPAGRYPDALALAEAFRMVVEGEALLEPEVWVRRDVVLSNPYKGLRAFSEADAADFFGREALTARLVSRLGEEGEYGRFLAVVGPSGSGKSSLVWAGLIPALRAGARPGSENWYVVEMLPGPHPFDELELSLLRVANRMDLNLSEQLQRDERGILRAARLVLPGEGHQLLLVIDQFEELFTLVQDPEETRRFMQGLHAAVTDERSPVWVVVTLRADFYDRPLTHPDFAALIQARTEVVVPMSTPELVSAICGPAERVGVRFEEGLEALMVAEVAEQPGSLPLLQYALTELFEQREDHHLTREAYEAIGGVAGALGRRAEDVYQSLGQSEQAAARQVFLRLVTLGEGVEDTRRRVRRTELEALTIDGSQSSKPVDQVLDAFGSVRLLSFDRDPVTRGPTVEVAHEALLREWTRLREWLDESRADLRLQRALGNATADWEANEREASFLLRGSRLEQYAGWAEATPLALTGSEQAYLQASLADETARRARRERLERRSRNFLRALVAVFAFATIIALALSIFASNQRSLALVEAASRATQQVIAEENAAQAQAEALARATQQALAEEEALARAEAEQQALEERDEARRQAAIGLAGQAELLAGGVDPQLSLLLALEAVEQYPYTWQAEHALGQAVLQHHLQMEMFFFTNSAWPSPDSTRIAGGKRDIEVWDAITGEQLLKFVAYPESGESTELQWSPSGDRIASSDVGSETKVWDAVTGELLLSLPEHKGYYLRWSPDGTRLLSMMSLEHDSAMVWDAATGEVLFELPGGYGKTKFAGWSPDGKKIATSLCKIYDGETGQELLTLADCEEHISENTQLQMWVFVPVRFWSPDGTRFASGFQDGSGGRVWDASTGEVLYELSGHDNRFDVYWSPDGERILTVDSFGKQAKMWDADSGIELYTLPGVTMPYADWSPDGMRLVTEDEPGWITIWDAETGMELRRLHVANGELYLHWSADGRWILTIDGDTLRIWDVADLHFPMGCKGDCPSAPFPGYLPYTAWSPDGRRIAQGFYDGSIRIWDVATQEEVARLELTAPAGDIGPFAWSPKGDQLLGVHDGGLLSIWDVSSAESQLVQTGMDFVSYVTWSPDQNQILTFSWEEGAKIWDVETMDVSLEFEQQAHWGYWSQDGSRIFSTEMIWVNKSGSAKVWDASTGEVLLDLFPPEFPYHVVEGIWSPDETRLLTFSSDGIGRIWDAQTGEELLSFNSGTDTYPVWWIPDSERILCTDSNSDLKIYNALSGEELLSYNCRDECRAYLAPDGRTIALASAIRSSAGPLYTLPIWQDLEELLERAHALVFRELTPEERAQFGLPQR